MGTSSVTVRMFRSRDTLPREHTQLETNRDTSSNSQQQLMRELTPGSRQHLHKSTYIPIEKPLDLKQTPTDDLSVNSYIATANVLQLRQLDHIFRPNKPMNEFGCALFGPSSEVDASTRNLLCVKSQLAERGLRVDHL